ncbi:hypothetical protein CRM22_005577 [Opisthorchis felineus]|uniref:Protein YIF1 n=1 Tax=Opisthorchis felineus TaxID=147828 RepID=A0A4S2LWC5_OPIFE|nr:hypothetical protein CRM22_005577 [Opisthorchis felineus]
MDYSGSVRADANEPNGYSQFYPGNAATSQASFYVPSAEYVNQAPPGGRRYVEQSGYPNYNFMPDAAVTGLAMQYGSAVVGQGADFVQRNVNSYLASSRIKYYFAVNNSYVAKKLGLLLFPFAHTKWSTHFDPSGPVPPGDDLNAPDLYIPLMAFITYVLVSGAIMGIQSRFSPELLGILSSEALGWLLLELLVFMFCIYVFNIQSHLSYLDIVAFSGYKFVRWLLTILYEDR